MMTTPTVTEKDSKYDRNHYLNVWLPDPELKKRLRIRAAEADVSISEYVRVALEAAVT